MTAGPRVVVAEIGHSTACRDGDCCILLWMAGGMAAPETFDPKGYQPFEMGLPVEKILSTFPAIDTAVDGVKICQGLEHIAKVMDRATLIRSHVQPDLGSILHSRHQYHWHTGYVPPQTVAAPHIGAWMARVLGPRNPVMPPFINIGQRLEGVGESEELKAFTTGGFFGSEFGPMNLPYPEEAARRSARPRAWTPAASPTATSSIRNWSTNPNRDFMSDYQQESMLRSLENAHRLLARARRRPSISVANRRRCATPTATRASAAAACWPAGWSKTARASSKSPPNTCPSSTGTPTRTAMRPLRG